MCSHSFETSRHFSLFRSNPRHNVTVYMFCQLSYIKSLKFGGFLAILDCHVSKHNTLSPIYSLQVFWIKSNDTGKMASQIYHKRKGMESRIYHKRISQRKEKIAFPKSSFHRIYEQCPLFGHWIKLEVKKNTFGRSGALTRGTPYL